MLEFRILGGLEAVSGGRRVPVGGNRERRVLAALVLDAGRVVPVQRLADVIWDDDPPGTAVKQVMNAVSALRRALDGSGSGDLIVKVAGGYRLAVDRSAVDAHMFEAGVSSAGQAAAQGRLAEAAGLLRSALGLWRGPALPGLGRSLEAAAAGWQERRAAALELCLGWELALGRHREVLGELAELAAAYPLREKLAGLHMVALYRSGRQADALGAYQATRELLAGRLGLDPGPELRQLHQQILTADPALAAPEPAPPVTGSLGPALPRELPAPVRHFTGRTAELDALTGLLDQASGQAPGAVVISAIGGTAGVGKTALALHWAHQVTGRFPDGQLYVNLRGFAPSGTPAAPSEAIRGFLDALGVPPERIPAAPGAQAGLYRTLLADRKMLIVLDNARDEDQVRPLLPASPASLVLVTSRSQLTGLAAADGARLIALDILTHDEAVQLLTARKSGRHARGRN